MTNYEAVIGLEVHVQAKTKTKIFCGCSTEFGKSPNENTCPVCTAQPGALPVLNKDVVRKAIVAGLALNCEIREHNVFARKNYFYPDLPKGYQISQYDLPICEYGWLVIDKENGEAKRIGITRIHMEEDAGKLVHAGADGLSGSTHSNVDYNRACVPLLEIVSEPDMRTPEEAYLYLEKLKQIIQYADVSDANMEEGKLRCDVNVSIRPEGQKEFGVKVELKNMNSFSAVRRALEVEIKRQEMMIVSGKEITQETRLWDEGFGKTQSMRSKEEAHDYRYFPEPDLIPLKISQDFIDEMKKDLPELPDQIKERFISEYGLDPYDVNVLLLDKEKVDFYQAAVKGADPKQVVNWLNGDMTAYMKENNLSLSQSKFKSNYLNKIVQLIEKKTISTKIAKDIIVKVFETGKDPGDLVKNLGMEQISDKGEILKIVQEVIKNNPETVEKYKSGKTNVMGFFVGQVMKATKGKAEPGLVNTLVEEELK
ncbi:Asp-tRNA(Asn)/Glu-tRNA(Gln) amidotransferase subunit GatB [Candidatus Margulisiibacteriota bacterium]